MASKLLPITVGFRSGNGHVIGHLYYPQDYNSASRYPAVAVGGPFTTVKEQVSGTYAAEMARRGILALAIDYRNYGESSGITRQYEDPAIKSEDLSAAVRFLAKRSDVTATGLLGICTSGGNILYPAAAAHDSSLKAIATVAGFFMDESLQPKLFGGEEGIQRRLTAARQAREHFDATGEIKMIKAYHPTDQTAASVSPSDYYMDETRGGGVRAWRNAFAVMSWDKWIAFDPVSQASAVSVPALIVHSQGAALPAQAQKVYDLLKGLKELCWVEEAKTHFDFYDNMAVVAKAADRVARHFHEVLG